MIKATENLITICDDEGELKYIIRKNGHVLTYSVKETTLTDYEHFIDSITKEKKV